MMSAPGTTRGLTFLRTPSCRGNRLSIAGELDSLAVPLLVDAARATADAGDLTLDFAQVVFIDAAGLGGLIFVQQALAEVGRGIRVVGAAPRIVRIFVLGGLHALLEPT